MPAWTFKEKTATDTDRDPIQGEFFAGEAIDNVGEALVREAIQNSLDNRAGPGPVRVRFYLSADGEELPPASIAAFTSGLFPHLQAERNGLASPPGERQRCAWVTVEDFGTTGLTGDPRTWNPTDNERNNFYSFFRAEGRSDKSGSDGGRWGVGKYVFPLCSRANTFFGLTITADDPTPRLLGRTILKSHRVSGTRFQPDGYFAEPPEQDVPPMPIRDASLLGDFRSKFKVARSSEPGLSVVIPWRLSEDSELSLGAIRAACLKDYFFPLLSGALVVQLESANESTVLNAGTTLEYARQNEEMAALVELASVVLSGQVGREVALMRHSSGFAPKWGAEMLSEEVTRTLTAALLDQTPLSIHVPLRIQPTGREPVWTTFLIHLRSDPGAGQSRPYFLRNDIRVSHASRRNVQDVHAIVEVRDPELSRMLGDSENPAHTEWRHETRGFKERYKYAPATLNFVKESVRELLRLINVADSAPDTVVLADLLPIPEDAEMGRPRRKRSKDGKEEEVTPPTPDLDLPRRRQVARVEYVPTGFRVVPTGAAGQLPVTLVVRSAYDIESGDPFSNYHEFDFDLARDLRLDCTGGAAVMSAERNEIELEITSLPFEMIVTGFDESRDVIVSISARSN